MEDYDPSTGTSKIQLKLDRVHAPGSDVTVGPVTVSIQKNNILSVASAPKYDASAWPSSGPQPSRVAPPPTTNKTE